MKYSTIIVLCFLPLLICDGVRVAINEKFIDSVLRNFLPEIQKFTKGTKLPDYGKLDRLKFSIPNFGLDKIALSFTNKGLLNLKINGLSPELSGRLTVKVVLVKIRKSFTITLKNFRFNGNLKITSKIKNGVRVPDIYFDSDPSINFSPKINLGRSIINKLLSALINGVASLAKKVIMPAIRKQIKKIVENVLKDLPVKIKIDKYELDVTLSESGIQARNKFLEINSVARLYNPLNSLTKSKYFKNVSFPRLLNMGSQLQIYVSEYSANAAIYTLLASNDQTIKSKINLSKIKDMLPSVKDEQANLVFTGTSDASLTITEQYLNVNLPGTLSIRNLNNEDIVKLELRLALKALASIQYGNKVTAEVKDFDINLGKLLINKSSEDFSVIGKGISSIKPILIPLLNGFIKSKMEIKFPTVMGISFTKLSLQHKQGYLQINYDLVRN